MTAENIVAVFIQTESYDKYLYVFQDVKDAASIAKRLQNALGDEAFFVDELMLACSTFVDIRSTDVLKELNAMMQ